MNVYIQVNNCYCKSRLLLKKDFLQRFCKYLVEAKDTENSHIHMNKYIKSE